MVPFEATELRFPGFLGRRSLRRRATAKALSTYLMVFQLVLSALSALSYNAVKKNGLLSWLVVLVPSVLGCCIGVQLLSTRRSAVLGGFSDAAPRADSRAPRRLAADAADAALRSSGDTRSEIGISSESSSEIGGAVEPSEIGISAEPGAAGGEGGKAADGGDVAMKADDSTGAAGVSAATPAAEATKEVVVATVEAPLLRLWQLRRDERGMVGQHGQSPPPPPPVVGQRPSLAPAPLQRAPGGSGWLSTPRREAAPLGSVQPLPRVLARRRQSRRFHHPCP